MEVDGPLVDLPVFGLHVRRDQSKPVRSVFGHKRIISPGLPIFDGLDCGGQFLGELVGRLAVGGNIFPVSVFDALAIELQTLDKFISWLFRAWHCTSLQSPEMCPSWTRSFSGRHQAGLFREPLFPFRRRCNNAIGPVSLFYHMSRIYLALLYA